MGQHAVTAVHQAGGLAADTLGALAFGTVVLDPRTPNPAREIVLGAGLPPSLPAHSVSAYCISGLHTVTDIATSIQSGRIRAGIAAGADSLSQPALLFGRGAVRAFTGMAQARTLPARLGAMAKLRPGHFVPVAPGVAEPSTGLTMGQHCEIMARTWNISRTVQDEIALRSHQRATAAWDDGRLAGQVAPLAGLDRDNQVRSNTSLEKLAALKPVFDRSEHGTLTAGNSSPLTDGGAAVLLASRRTAEEAGAPLLAVIKDWEYAALDIDDGLLMAPALAVPRLLARHGLTMDDIDLIEVHEAFAAQVEANLMAWEQGWNEPPIGRVDPERLNVCGSSIAVGHPFAATGGRILMTLAYEMARRGARRGLISICAAGGMAGAMLLEQA
jgi:acetyl-CoA acetyltransferase family protein